MRRGAGKLPRSQEPALNKLKFPGVIACNRGGETGKSPQDSDFHVNLNYQVQHDGEDKSSRRVRSPLLGLSDCLYLD